MIEARLNEEDLELVEVRSLTFEESIQELLDGGIIVLQDYEKTRGKDVLVKLDTRKYAITKISHDANIMDYEEPYWQIHNVSLNAISLHIAYKKEVYDSLKEYKFLPGNVVHVVGEDPLKVSVVEDVYRDRITGEVFYALGDREGMYRTEDLKIYKGLK